MYAKLYHDGYRRLEARYTTHLWEYMRRKEDVHHQDIRQAAVEEELVTVGVELEGMLRGTDWDKMQQMELRMSFAVSYFLYFLYKERYVASSQGELAGSMADESELVVSFMGTFSTSLEAIELLLSGALPLKLYPGMQKLKPTLWTDADRALEYCFMMRYGEDMPKNAKLRFVKWLQSDEPGRSTRA